MSLFHLLKVPPPTPSASALGLSLQHMSFGGPIPNHSHAQRKHAEQRLRDAAPPPHGSPLLLISGLLTSQPGCVWSSHYTVLTPTFGQKLVTQSQPAAGERLGDPGGHESSLFLKREVEKLCL